MWKIYYTDTTVTGENQQDWIEAPDHNVQVVVEYREPTYRPNRTYKDDRGNNCLVLGKHLWDGTDEYDPFGWGVKYGALLPDIEYYTIWNTACGNN